MRALLAIAAVLVLSGCPDLDDMSHDHAVWDVQILNDQGQVVQAIPHCERAGDNGWGLGSSSLHLIIFRHGLVQGEYPYFTLARRPKGTK